MDPVTQLVNAWAAAQAQDRPRLIEQIVVASRDVAVRAARCLGLQAQDCADVEQHASTELVRHLESGGIFRRGPEAFVWTVAQRKALDLKRRRKREATRDELVRGEYEVAPRTASPLDAMLDEELNERSRTIISELLERAPENYRRIVQRRIFDDVLIEEIVEEYYETKIKAGEVNVNDPNDVAVKRGAARSLVDRHWYLAKQWLRKELASSLEELER